MAKNVIFNMAVAAILDFAGYEFWGQKLGDKAERAMSEINYMYLRTYRMYSCLIS